MKTQPKFKLNCNFHGPFRVYEVTSTNVKVKPVTNPDVESRTISLQQVSKCKGSFPTNQSWLGHNLPNQENGERSGNEIPRILHLTPVLTWNRQFHLVIGQDMEEQSSHRSDFKRGGMKSNDLLLLLM